MRPLSIHCVGSENLTSEGLVFLHNLAEGSALSVERARFLLAVAHQYQDRGLSWKDLLAAAYEGLRRSEAQYAATPELRARFSTWGIRPHGLSVSAANEA